MKFNAFGLMRSNPGFTMENHAGPIDFSANVKGSAKASIGAISIKVGEIPIKLRIPFLKHRHLPLVIGSIGGTTLKSDPFSLSIEEMGLSVNGILGNREKGLHVRTDAKVTCQTEMEASGRVGGKVGIGSIDLGDDCDHDEHHEHDRHGDERMERAEHNKKGKKR
jgi:hypothetical protein